MNYSVLASGQCAEKLFQTLPVLLAQGIKAFVFISAKSSKKYALFKKYKHFNLYPISSKSISIPSLLIEDGQVEKKQASAFDKLCTLAPDFNQEQYVVEHYNTTDTLIVRASAGTGKTTVMIDRIAYLLCTVPGLVPADIGMMTFTNEATNNMQLKLQQKLIDLYNSTRQQKYLHILERLSDIQIATIDSFFKMIISNEGTQLGYGSNVSVRSYLFEKKKIIEDVVNDIFIQDGAEEYLKKYILPVNQYVTIALECWKALNSRGYYYHDIDAMDWGSAEDKNNKIVNNMLKRIIVEAEKRYLAMKIRDNAFTMTDIKADMDSLTNTSTNQLRKTRLKFLFVDEFQDTDNSQIRSIAWLKKALGCQLFVVGDIKQSIYRFRGAEESAFDELVDCLMKDGADPTTIQTLFLSKNYRTSATVLTNLNKLFETWGKRDYLVWDSPVVPRIMTPGNIIRETFFIRKQNADLSKHFISKLKECIQQPEKYGKQICILNRKNYQVREVAEWCRDAKIPCMAKQDGGFYHTKPVLDFLALLGALTYPKNVKRLYNFLLTPYSVENPSSDCISSNMGNESGLLSYFKSLLENDQWQKVLTTIQREPVFIALRKIVDFLKPLEQYMAYTRQQLESDGFEGENLEKQLAIDVKSYELNLNKLFNILYENFTGEFASLVDIFDFLNLKVRTNALEEIVYPEIDTHDGNFIIEAMTVHKAKGLEFDTVMITHMYNSFFLDPEKSKRYRSFITKETKSGSIQLGWRFNAGYNGIMNNKYFTDMEWDENDAERREETRILYVALTRCKQNVICFLPRSGTNEDSWASLMAISAN
jgi:DNA helicase-2/ATP-dependent DNA helicase PcrA